MMGEGSPFNETMIRQGDCEEDAAAKMFEARTEPGRQDGCVHLILFSVHPRRSVAPADVFRSSAGESYPRLVAQGKSNRQLDRGRKSRVETFRRDRIGLSVRW
jgi:hypothetical protein